MNKSNLPKSLCMVVHSYYPGDTRVRREAELLVLNNVAVDVVCLRNEGETKKERVGGVNVRRLAVRRHRGASVPVYLLEYLTFIFLASFVLTVRCIRKKCEVLQFHNPPDYIVFAGFLPRLLGVKIVLDMHEIIPELFMNRWGLGEGNIIIWITKFLERISIAFSNRIMTVSDPVKEVIQSRSGKDDITVVMNVADNAIFKRKKTVKRSKPGLIRITYHGIVAPWYDLTSVIKAIGELCSKEKEVRFDIFGDGPDVEMLDTLIRSYGLSSTVFLRGKMKIEEIKEQLECSDIGVVPLVNSKYYADLAMPTKLLELAALGVPALVPRVPIIERYFDETMVQYYKPDDEADMRTKLEQLIGNEELRASISGNVKRFCNRYTWENQGEAYMEMLRKLAQ